MVCQVSSAVDPQLSKDANDCCVLVDASGGFGGIWSVGDELMKKNLSPNKNSITNVIGTYLTHNY